MLPWLFPLAVVILAILAYWELVIAEGVHLGAGVVAYLYDLVARRYNNIKQFDPSYEAWFLSEPLAYVLHDIPTPLVLDVATGTGRLPITLLAQGSFGGRVIALDSSRKMLAEAARGTFGVSDRLALIWQGANRLPFDDDTFDAVTCLEALEFMPDTRQTLAEIVRVLQPGGVTLLTNRVGPWAKFLHGHTQSRPAFEAMLAMLGLERIQTQTWQVEYDLVWARKPGSARNGSAQLLAHILRCPRCKGPMTRGEDSFTCGACGRAYPVAPDGVTEMMHQQTKDQLRQAR